MRASRRDFLTGLASITALVGFAILLLRFGELDPIFNERYVVTVNIDSAAGLRIGSPVELNGVPIGIVDRLELQDDEVRPVRLEVLVAHETLLPDSIEASVGQSLLGGAATLRFTGDGDATGVLPTDGTAVVDALYTSVLNQITSVLDERMAPVLEALGEFATVAETYNALGVELESLFSEQSTADIEGGASPNLRTMVGKFNGAIEEATRALELANEWLGDEQLHADARIAVERAGVLIDSTTETVKRYTALADRLDRDIAQLTQQILPVADQMSVTLEEIQRLTSLAATGEGTIGQLLSNPDLYRSLTDAATRLEQTLVEVTLLVQKLKTEGIAIEF